MGVVSASFLATKCLAKVAEEIEPVNPLAASVIRRSFYMDDLLTGAEDVTSVEKLQSVIHSSLAAAQFPLKKYVSNSTDFLEIVNHQ